MKKIQSKIGRWLVVIFLFTTTNVFGQGDYYAEFNGENSYLRAATFNDFNDSNFSISFWVKPVDASQYQIIAQLSRSMSDANTEFMINYYNNKVGFWDYENGYGFDHITTEGEVPLNEWSHIVFTKDGTTGKFYINSVLDSEHIAAKDCSYGANDFVIGRDLRNETHYLDAKLSSFKYFDTTLSSEQISGIENQNPQSHWFFSQSDAGEDENNIHPLNAYNISVDCVDEDDDGICNVDEIMGCEDNTACNYSTAATENDGSCIYAEGCESCSGDTDGTGVVVDSDLDDDGVCDAEDINWQDVIISTSITADNHVLVEWQNTSNYNGFTGSKHFLVYRKPLNSGSWQRVYWTTYNSYYANYTHPSATPEASFPQNLTNTGFDTGSSFVDMTADIGLSYEYKVISGFGECSGYKASCSVSEDFIPGCMDVPSCNYNEYANVNDGSCINAIGDYSNSINVSSYQYTMTYTSALTDDLNSSGDYTIAVYDNCELLGYAYYDNEIESLNYAFLTIYSNDFSQAIEAYLVDSNGDIVKQLDDIDFESDAVVGTVISPILYALGEVIEGCTDASAYNYDASATIDDASCVAIVYGCTDVNAFNYNIEANTDDSSCIAQVLGCIDVDASNYNDLANTNDDSCVSWEEAYNNSQLTVSDLQLTIENQDLEIDVQQASIQELNSELATQNLTLESLTIQLETAIANQEDGINQSHVDEAYDNGVSSVTPDDGIGQEDVDSAYGQGLLDGDDGVYQSDVDAVEIQVGSLELVVSGLELDNSNLSSNVESLTSDNVQLNTSLNEALANQEDGINQTHVDEAYANGVASVIPEDGIGQADVDNAYSQGLLDGDDGVYQSDVDAVEIQVGSLELVVSGLELDNSNLSSNVESLTSENVQLNTSLNEALANQEDGINQTHVDQAYADGAASVTPEDGIGQEDVDSAYSQGLLDGDDGVYQSDVDAVQLTVNDLQSTISSQATEIGMQLDSIVELNSSLITLNSTLDSQSELVEDYALSVSNLQLTVDNLELENANLTTNNQELTITVSSQQSAISILEDSIQIINIELEIQNSTLDSLTSELVEAMENQESHTEVDRYINLPEGWSMFGYTCAESVDVSVEFSAYEDQITIIKDEWGLSWLVEYGYNALGSLKYGQGYQIKTTSPIEGFQFCPNIE